MQGDTCGKSAEEIEMEKIMGFSGFHQSREKYFEEQSSTLGSAKAGFSPKYDKFFPKKSEFDSPNRAESKETKYGECKWLSIEINVRNKTTMFSVSKNVKKLSYSKQPLGLKAFSVLFIFSSPKSYSKKIHKALELIIFFYSSLV